MNYDFFEEEKQGNDDERIPAPLQSPKKPTKAREKIKWRRVLLTVGVAALSFGCGMLATWSALDNEIRTLLTVKDKIQEDYYKDVTDEEFYKAIFGGINDTLLDDYSKYMTKEEFEASISDLAGNRIGLGLTFASGGKDPLRITRVCGNSPAEAAGILAGERIIGYGKIENEITTATTFEAFSSFLQDYGEKEEFVLQLQSGESERFVTVYKAAYVENYVFYRTNEKAYTFMGEEADVIAEKGVPLTCLNDDTAYIRLVQFTGNAARGFDLAMAQFKEEGKKNLVLDLRGNGGGYLDTMQSIASYFCKSATVSEPVVAVADFGDKHTSYQAHGNRYYQYFTNESNIYVLADAYSASASECLIGCMIDYGAIDFSDICLVERGGVAKTYGKGIMQETQPVNLLEGDAITLTTAEICWPLSNRNIHGRGVLPEDGAKTIAENIDYEKETENAIKILLG
jgi:carboxyl-terminal processing protease